MENQNTSEIRKIVELAAESINVGHKVFADKRGLFTLLELTDEVSSISGADFSLLKSQLAEFSPEERKAEMKAFSNKLVLSNKVLESKIESGGDFLDEVVDYGIEQYIFLMGIKDAVLAKVEEAKALIEKGKKLFE